MIATANDFWRLASQSRLFSPDECRQLEESFYRRPDSAGDAGAKAAAQWLVSAGMLTRFQAQSLLGGRVEPLVIGDYRVQDRIADGRLAGLLRAVDAPSGHPVLLFPLPESLARDPQKFAATKRQTHAAALAKHPNLARVYEWVEADGKQFIALEVLEGRTVPRTLPGPLPVGKSCRIAHSVATALGALHAARQPHGAIAPWNVWVQKDGEVKLLHFPLSRKLPPGMSGEEQTAAAADYLSPELAQQGARPTPSADVYSLGSLFYQLLTGQPPFAGASEKIARSASAAPAPLPKSVPKELASLVLRMLAKSSHERPADGGQVADLLGSFAEVQSAQPSSDGNRTAVAFESRLANNRQQPQQFTAPPVASQTSVAPPIQTTAPTVRPIPMATSVAVTPVNAPPLVAPIAVPIASAVTGSAASDKGAFVFNIAPEIGATRTTPRRRGRRSRQQNLVVAGVCVLLAACAIGALAAYYRSDSGQKILAELAGNTSSSADGGARSTDGAPGRKPANPQPTVAVQTNKAAVAPNSQPDVAAEIPDDGKTLWAAPTAGQAIDLRYLPAGGQAFLALRPAELLTHPEGPKILAALGPGGDWAKSELERIIGLPLDQIQQLTIGLYPQGSSPPSVAFVARLTSPIASDRPLPAWQGASSANESGKQIFKSGDTAYFIPPAGDGKILAVMPVADAKDTLSADGPPPLRREMERLLKAADSQRHVNLLIAPSVLMPNARGMFVGHLERLQSPLERFLGPNVQAALVSLHLSDAFYAELRVLGSLDQDAFQLARRYQERVAQSPSEVVSYLSTIPSPHAQRIFLQIPLMLSVLSDYVRIGQENNQAVLNCYLPVEAAHNLIMATELALATRPGGTAPVAVASNTNSQAKAAASVAEALQKKTSLSFDRNTLEQAMGLLAEDLGVKIVIIGGDLQLEGITKNQSFALDEREKTADEILRTVLKKANADNKLVYVIKREQPGGPEALFITTHAAAEKRGDELPEGFAAAKPAKK